MSKEKIEEAKALLIQLRNFLTNQDQKNWITGVESALHALESGKFDDASSTYRSMTEGGSGLSEWYIHKDDPTERAAANKRLVEIRAKLWTIFGR